jgi:hypothetical protein
VTSHYNFIPEKHREAQNHSGTSNNQSNTSSSNNISVTVKGTKMLDFEIETQLTNKPTPISRLEF